MNKRQRKRQLYWPLSRRGVRHRYDKFEWLRWRTFRKYRSVIMANVINHNALWRRLIEKKPIQKEENQIGSDAL